MFERFSHERFSQSSHPVSLQHITTSQRSELVSTYYISRLVIFKLFQSHSKLLMPNNVHILIYFNIPMIAGWYPHCESSSTGFPTSNAVKELPRYRRPRSRRCALRVYTSHSMSQWGLLAAQGPPTIAMTPPQNAWTHLLQRSWLGKMKIMMTL